jgi:hypothetical protein
MQKANHFVEGHFELKSMNVLLILQLHHGIVRVNSKEGKPA